MVNEKKKSKEMWGTHIISNKEQGFLKVTPRGGTSVPSREKKKKSPNVIQLSSSHFWSVSHGKTL